MYLDVFLNISMKYVNVCGKVWYIQDFNNHCDYKIYQSQKSLQYSNSL